jgi:hypothetical protein
MSADAKPTPVAREIGSVVPVIRVSQSQIDAIFGVDCADPENCPACQERRKRAENAR